MQSAPEERKAVDFRRVSRHSFAGGIRKQFGVGSLLFIFLLYVVEIIVFPIGVLIEKITSGKNRRYRWNQVKGYISNVFLTMRLLPKMIANKPYFYKM